jgi:prophage regulatory protein
MPDRILRLPAVRELTGLPCTEVYRQMKEGLFPPSLPLGPRTVGWLESEVQEWIAGRVAARGASMGATVEAWKRNLPINQQLTAEQR